MRYLVISLALAACGTDKDRPSQEPTTRPVSLYMAPDMVLDSLDQHACYANCVVARVGQDNYLCWGKEWRRMSDLMGEGEVMYCDR